MSHSLVYFVFYEILVYRALFFIVTYAYRLDFQQRIHDPKSRPKFCKSVVLVLVNQLEPRY